MVSVVKGAKTLGDIARALAPKPKPRVEMVRQTHIAPLAQKSAAFRCSACGKLAFATFKPGVQSPQERLKGINAALEEHRRVCTGGDSLVGRKFDIWYPRA